MACLIIVSTPGPGFVRIKARFGQVGDQVDQAEDQVGQGKGQGQELDNLQVSSFEKFSGGVGWWGGLFDYSVYSWPRFCQGQG